jgi:small subunit ribosomal protein S25e
MGGTKKKPLGSSDMRNGTAGTSGQSDSSDDSASNSGKKSKKDDAKKTGIQQQHRQKLSVIVEETSGRRALENMKAITIQGLARAVGVKISVANAFIKSLESKNVLRCVGGYSGHRVYQMKG